MAPADAASSRWRAALAFAASLLLLCALATSRVHLESHALAPPCSALLQLPAPPPSPAPPPLPAGIHLAATLLDGEPTPASGAAPLAWDPHSALLPALRALRARLAASLDVTLAPPRRLAYGALADPGLLLPLAPAAASAPPAYLVPAWAAPALRGLNPDWPLATGASDARVAYPLGEAAAAAAEHEGAEASDPVLASSCQAVAVDASSSSAFGDAGSEPSLGRSLPATAAAAARALQRLLHLLAPPPPPTPAEACAPYNALLCSARGGNATRSAPTPHCAHHRGGEVVNLILYRAPAAISPLLFEAAEGALPLPPYFHAQRFCEAPRASGNGSAAAPASYCTTGTPLRHFPGLGWVYALPHAPPPSWQADAAAALSAAVLASLSAPHAALAAAHAAAAAGAAAALCAEDGAAGGQWWWWHWLVNTRMEGLKRRIPRHVAAELAAAVAALARYGSSGSSGSEALAHARRARAHATAAAQDAVATLDGYVAPAHVLAIYLPWWAPVVLPLALALAAPLRGQRGAGAGAAGGGGRRRCACSGSGSGARAQADGSALTAGEEGAGGGKKER